MAVIMREILLDLYSAPLNEKIKYLKCHLSVHVCALLVLGWFGYPLFVFGT
jgi:hypothetical protein